MSRLTVLAAALVALAAVLLLPERQAQAQNTVWSATLTVAEASDRFGCGSISSLVGCSTTPDFSNVIRLTDNDFDHGGTTYSIADLYIDKNADPDRMRFSVSGSVSNSVTVSTGQQIKTALGSMTLNLGTVSLAISSATASGSYIYWPRGTLSWSNGDTVSVSLTEPAATKPAKPTGFSATAGDGNVALAWTNPSDSSITKYQYQQKAGSAAWGSWTDVPSSSATTTSYTVPSLMNGTAYRFRIRAVNAAGNSPDSDTAGPVTPADTTRPAKPTGFTAAPGNTQVTLRWANPSDSTITKWQYRQKTTGNYGSWQNISGSGATTTSHTVTGLMNGTAYTFQVRAHDAGGAGATSDAASATPAATVPDGATFTPDPSGWFKKDDTVSLRVKVTLSASDVSSASQPFTVGIARYGSTNCTGTELTYTVGSDFGNLPTATQHTIDATVTLDNAGTFANPSATASDNFCVRIASKFFAVEKKLPLAGFKVDATKPTVAFPPSTTPTEGQSYTLTLGDAHSKLKKYGAIAVDGSTGAAADCDTAAEVGSTNLTTEATAQTSKSFVWTVPASSAGKKVCVYAEDAAGNIHSALGGTAIVSPPAAPTVSSVAVTSSVPDNQDGHYKIGDTVTATVTFSAAVNVTGTPRLELQVGSNARRAAYAGGTGTTALTFDYTVVEGDEDSDGIAIRANKLTLSGGTIKETTDVTDANRNFSAVAANSAHKVDGVRPTVTAGSTGYYSDAALSTALTGPQKSGDIYTKVTFSEDMKHAKDDGAAARPELFHRIGSADTQYDILDNGDTLASGDCKPNHASNTNVYVCLYTVGSSDNGAFAAKAGTNSVDKADNALASAYTHAATLTLDTTDPTIGFPSGVTPSVGTAATISLADAAGSKLAKYGIVEVAGTATDATGCDDPSASGDNFTTTAVSPLAARKLVSHTPVTAGKKVCVYAEDAAGNNDSALWATAIAAAATVGVTGVTVTPDPAFPRTKLIVRWTAKSGAASYHVRWTNEANKDELQDLTPASVASLANNILEYTVTTRFAPGVVVQPALTAGTTIYVKVLPLPAGNVFASTLRTLLGQATSVQGTTLGTLKPVVTAALAGDTAVTLTWPSVAIHTDIASFQYRQEADSGSWSAWSAIPNSDKDTVTHTVSSLTGGTAYRFQVQAHSSAGAVGEASEPTTAVTTPDTTAPTVTSGSTGYYGNAALSTALTGPQKSGASIYTKVTFSEDMKHTKSDGASARPELFHRIGSADTQYDILDNGDTLASGDCKPNHASDTDVYVCLYTVGSSDSGAFAAKVGTNSVDKANNALASAYTHAATLTLDTADPNIAFPSGVTPTVGTAATITLTDATAKVAKYGIVEVAGTATDATGCDDPSAGGDNFTTTAVSPLASSENVSYTPVTAGKKVCVYAEDAAGNSASALWSTAIAAASTTVTPPPSGAIWSATLTTNIASLYSGCSTGSTQGSSSATYNLTDCSSALSDDDFVHAGTTYTIVELSKQQLNAEELDLRFGSGTAQAAKTALAGLTLNIGGTKFAIDDASVQTSGSQRLRWSGTALPGHLASTVSVSLTAPAATKPPAPERVNARAVSSTKIQVTWQSMSVTPPGQAPVTGYRLEESTDGGATWTEVIQFTSAGNAVWSRAGLSPGTTRHYRVRATSALGDGPWSDTVSATTAAAGAPAVPTGLSADGGNASVTLTWTDPQNAAITGWEVRYAKAAAAPGAWTAIPGSSASTVTHTVTGLENGARYQFWLRAVAGAVKGLATTTYGTPTEAAAGFAAVGDIGGVTLIWDAQNDPAIVGWEYQHMTSGTWSEPILMARSGPGTSSHRVTGLSAGVTYHFRVRAAYAGGVKGDWSATSNGAVPQRLAAGAPDAVTGLTAVAGNARATLSWDNLRLPLVRDPGYVKVAGWEVRYAAGSSWGEWEAVELPGGMAAHFRAARVGVTLTRLANGTAHHFQVRAVSERPVAGPASDAATATPSGSIPAVAVTPGTDRLEVSWAGAAEPRALTYGVDVRSGSYLNKLAVFGGSGVILKHLTPGTVYAVRVTWSGGFGGDGALIGEVRATTLGAAAAPGRVTELRVRNWVGNSGLEAVWAPVVGADGYKVQWKSGNEEYAAAREAAVAGEATSSHIVSGLMPGREYTVRVLATREGTSDGAPSAEASAWVRGAWTTSGDGELTVHWALEPNPNIWGVQVDYRTALAENHRSYYHNVVAVRGGSFTLKHLIPGQEYVVRVGYLFDIAGHEQFFAEVRGTPSGAAELVPQMSAASVRGDVMRIGYDASLDGDSTPPAGSYSVRAGQAQRAVSGVAVAGQTVTLRLAEAVGAGAAVTVDYHPPPGDGAIRSAAGHAAPGFSGRSVENGTPAALSVADAQAAEGASLAFAVTLDRAASGPVTVAWATADGTATAGADYEAASGTLTFAPGETEKTVEVALLEDTAADDAETLTLTLRNPTGATLADAGATGTVTDTAPALPPLTASIAEAPTEHGGKGKAFAVRIAFSAPLADGAGKALRKHALSVDGGAVRSVKRVDGRRDLWSVRIRPARHGAVTLRLASPADCASAGAICTADGRALTNAPTVTVTGPPALSVADARAKEGADETIDFAVTLSRAASGEVTVRYVTRNGTAKAGEDYRRARGKLTFAAGETEKTIAVALLDDARDEGEETFTLVLSKASGAVIADGEAVGTIENSDPLQQAWLARFGRTVATQAVDAVTARLEGLAPGAHATLAGQALDLSRADDAEALAEAMTGLARAFGAPAAPAPEGGEDPFAHGSDGTGVASSGARSMSGRELLLGSSFHLATGDEAGGPGFAAWGRAAHGSFEGEAGDVTLDGDVTTGFLGADVSSGRWLAGAAIAHSQGEGTFALTSGMDSTRDRGTVESTLTSVLPYARVDLSERVSAWGLAGWGTGTLTLTETGETETGETETKRYRTDLSMTLGAVGARGALLTPEEASGFALALKGDAFFVRTESDATAGMAAAQGDASRLRLALDGSRSFDMGGGAALTPSLELGVRHDGGDAETGFGADIGGGLAYSGHGLTAALHGRGLLSHEAGGMRERGFSGSLAWDPRPDTDRGMSLSLTQTVGASASGGADALLGRETLAGLAANDNGADARRLELKLGYGFPAFGGGFTGTPNIGVGLSNTGRDYRLGWRLTSAVPGDPGFEVNLDATRKETANGNEPPEHGVMLRGAIRW